jgi:urease accessory protein
MTTAGWRGHLTLRYRRVGERTQAHDQHVGPLRVLQPLHPEGPAICHHVVVHPPGGVVAGDELMIDVDVGEGAHALITTPGATRFYRSEGALARQQATLKLAGGARLEWLPMESIAYSGCRAQNQVIAHLAPGAEMMGWDILTLGLPAARQPFVSGFFAQHLELPGLWLERGRVAAADKALLQSPLAWAGHPVLATFWFAQGSVMPTPRRERLLDAARDVVAAHELARTAGVTAAQNQLLVLRVLASKVEPAMQLLAAVRAAWRQAAWGLRPEPPRIWRT